MDFRDYDPAIGRWKGRVRLCIDSCPTETTVATYVVDENKCIAYFTIELKEAIPTEMKENFGMNNIIITK